MSWRLRGDVRLIASDKGIVAAGGDSEYVMLGAALGLVGGLVARGLDEAAMLDACADSLSPPEFYFALNALRDTGLIVDGGDAADDFWAGAIRPDLGFGTLAFIEPEQAPVWVALADTALAERARSAAFGTLHVARVDDLAAASTVRVAAECAGRGEAFFPVCSTGRMFLAGPLILPGTAPCMACAARWLRLNRDLDDVEPTISRPARDRSGRDERLFRRWAAIEIGRVMRGDPDATGRIRGFDWFTRELRDHRVHRWPQCPACGDPEAVSITHRLAPVATPKIAGGQRGLGVDALPALFADRISPLTGALRWLEPARAAGHDRAWTASAGHAFRLGRDTLEWRRRAARISTGGKGASWAAAASSAIGEAAERLSGVYRGDEATIHARFADIERDAIPPNLLTLFSERQFAERDSWNGALGDGLFQAVPNRFDPMIGLDWVRAWSPTAEHWRYLPASYCYFGHPDTDRHYFFSADSNGCAAGGSLVEAFCHALYELVERDSVAIWWYNRLARPRVDAARFGLAEWAVAERRYESLGRDIWALDLTTDVDIPAIAAISARRDGPTDDIIFGFAAHLDPAEALRKSLDELNQFLPAVEERGVDGRTAYRWPEPEAIRFWQEVKRSDAAYCRPAGDLPPRRRDDFPCRASDDLGRDMATSCDLLRKAGLDAYVVDLTRPEIGLPVCRVVVPGLRHFWRRLGPGRLYEAPVAMGWLDQARAEADLNPWSVFV